MEDILHWNNFVGDFLVAFEKPSFGSNLTLYNVATRSTCLCKVHQVSI